MGAPGRGGAAIVALAVALALPACGDDEGSAGPSDEAVALLDHVPRSGEPELAFADFDAAREQLGLPDDADLAEFPAGADEEDPQARLATTAGLLIRYLSLPPQQQTPLPQAIDHGAVRAAASNVVTGGPGITVLSTSQSFDDIAAALEDRGYQRDGGTLEDDSASIRFAYPLVADAGDGVIVLGYARGPVEDAVAGTSGSDHARALLERVEGVVRDAVTFDSKCVHGLAVGESYDPEAGEVRIEVEGEAEAERFRLADSQTIPQLEYGDPQADGNALTVGAQLDPNPEFDVLLGEGPITLLRSDLAPTDIYAC